MKGRYPYQVGLAQTRGGKPFCGGTLVAEDWVLSAAHCKLSNDPVYAIIGRHDFSDDSESGFEVIKTSWQTKHPNYNSANFNNDYMMIKLSTSSSFAPASLDDGSQDLSDGVDVTVMGWGTTKEGGSTSDVLFEVELDMVTNNDCSAAYGGDVTNNMICAARDGKDSCQGDSGGPLIIKGANEDGSDDVVVGVVSWGSGCARPAYPGVYASVNKRYSWITSEIDSGVEPEDDDTVVITPTYPTYPTITPPTAPVPSTAFIPLPIVWLITLCFGWAW